MKLNKSFEFSQYLMKVCNFQQMCETAQNLAMFSPSVYTT